MDKPKKWEDLEEYERQVLMNVQTGEFFFSDLANVAYKLVNKEAKEALRSLLLEYAKPLELPMRVAARDRAPLLVHLPGINADAVKQAMEDEVHVRLKGYYTEGKLAALATNLSPEKTREFIQKALDKTTPDTDPPDEITRMGLDAFVAVFRARQGSDRLFRVVNNARIRGHHMFGVSDAYPAFNDLMVEIDPSSRDVWLTESEFTQYYHLLDASQISKEQGMLATFLESLRDNGAVFVGRNRYGNSSNAFAGCSIRFLPGEVTGVVYTPGKGAPMVAAKFETKGTEEKQPPREPWVYTVGALFEDMRARNPGVFSDDLFMQVVKARATGAYLFGKSLSGALPDLDGVLVRVITLPDQIVRLTALEADRYFEQHAKQVHGAEAGYRFEENLNRLYQGMGVQLLPGTTKGPAQAFDGCTIYLKK